MQENDLVRKAVLDVGVSDSFDVKLVYSARFKDFNANLKYSNSSLVFSLSKKWLEFSQDLRIGLIQSLCCKVFKFDVKTLEMDLYDKFLSNLKNYSKVLDCDEVLLASFNRVNEDYFDGFMERPNLVWGDKAYTKLGHFEHQTNTVLVSSIFKKNLHLLDFIVFHELLHKKHGLKKSGSRYIHHSKEFRLDEKRFKDKNIEKKLRNFVRIEKFKGFLGF
ncbi:MAG: hypothetical protein ACMXX7_03110 [Candidatus Woesearchaeota archaeon]